MDLAGWVLLGVVLIILIYEAWAVVTHHLTISQWTRRRFRERPWWWTVLGMAVIGLTLWHLFFGGPL